MSRHILVKYSERGLVVGGRVSPLFSQLYLTITVAASLVSYTVAISRHLVPGTTSQDMDPIFLRTETGSLQYYVLAPFISSS